MILTGTAGRDQFIDDDEIVLGMEDAHGTFDVERLIHSLPQAQVEVLICLYLGFSPVETTKILHYPNIVRYYNVSAKLRQLCREQNEA